MSDRINTNPPLNLKQPKVMGVLNITPDSFYAESRTINPQQALNKAIQMINEGAAIIDIGGEPTNPFAAQTVSVQQELDRVIPVIELLSQNLSVPISIDTSQPTVMLEAVNAGASLINDVRALRLPGAIEAAAKANVPVCLMHMRYLAQEDIGNLSNDINIMDCVIEFLAERIKACLKAGIGKNNIIIDPGFGSGRFGKSLMDNLYILHYLSRLKKLECPILVGLSRKLFIGELLAASPDERLYGSIAAAAIAIYNGVNIIRTHDVKATADAVKLTASILEVA